MAIYGNTAKSSGALVTASSPFTVTTAGAGACAVASINVLTGTAVQTVLTLKDGGSGGTTKWVISKVADTNAGDTNSQVYFNPPLQFTTDLYATLAGTGAVAYISYINMQNPVSV